MSISYDKSAEWHAKEEAVERLLKQFDIGLDSYNMSADHKIYAVGGHIISTMVGNVYYNSVRLDGTEWAVVRKIMEKLAAVS